jgi:antitoxin component YwqK of YwqJK toxin-antitoxin module
MTKEEVFKHNLERWTPLNNDAAQKLPDLKYQEVLLCQNEDGQDNLQRTLDSITQYFHSEVSPLREAQQWFLSLDLKGDQVLYVYGIGLGYYYDVIKDWLKGSPQSFVVFLEDNLEVIKHFLETERATDFLDNKQVKLFYIEWETSYFYLGFLTSLFPLFPLKVSALKYYEKIDPRRIVELHARVAFFHDMRMGTCAEFLSLSTGSGFISNYYINLLQLPSSKLELKMESQFKGVPAIICGAGPSLAKNIHILKNLQDKALIMAGGTAMNALNAAGITPHFGLGIDPNQAHYKRLISNTAFESPFFYRQRMYSQALRTIHGEHIFVTGAGGYRLPAWFEEKLEIPFEQPIEEGHNVVNFNLSIAKHLGCNPILIVGVDLAYSDNQSYAPGLVRHAIHDPKDAFITKYSHEELLVKNDIYGLPVNTLWKWVNESLWYSQFASANLEMAILNCTEGGIGFARVPNMKLAEAAEKYLTNRYDFDALIHGSIQNSPVPENLNVQKILDQFDVLIRSLLKAETYCGQLLLEYGKLFQQLQSNEPVPDKYKTPEMEEFQTKLENEEGYKCLLQDYKERFVEIFFPRLHFIESDPLQYAQRDIVAKRSVFDVSLFTFLTKVARLNISMMNNIVESVNKEKLKPAGLPSKKTLALQQKLKEEHEQAVKSEFYSYQDHHLQIRDPEMGLDYSQDCVCDMEKTTYENGSVKSLYHKFKGQLHGPIFFYAENGQLLAENWYIQGQLVGKGKFYFSTGELYAVKRYTNGLLDGRQEYYYRDGMPKTLLYYKAGKLDNEVLLFHENGKIKREMHFVLGKREGLERMWNEEGMLMLEAYYKGDNPIETAREWHANGHLAKEIVYDGDSEEFEIKQWDEKGTPIRAELTRGNDYFDLMAGYSKSLNNSLHDVYQTLVSIAPSIPEESLSNSKTSIENDLLMLKQEMDKLEKYNHDLLIMSGHEGKNPTEALWKTPAVEKMMRAQMDEISKSLSEMTGQTQASLKDLFEKLEKMKKNENE